MQISVNMIVLDEENWVKAAIDSVYEWADEIIIVEGCVQEYVDLGFANKDFLSNDATTAILDTYTDPDNKLTIIRRNTPWKHKNEMRQATLDASSCDWVLVLDGDEAYMKKDLWVLREMASTSKKQCISFEHKNFWTFDKILDEGKPCIMERFFRRVDGMTYPDKNTGQSALNPDGTFVWHNKEHTGNIFVYHYAKLKPKDYTYRKSQYYLVRDYGKTKEQAPAAAQEDYKRWRKQAIDYPIEEHPEAIKDTEIYKEYVKNGFSKHIH